MKSESKKSNEIKKRNYVCGCGKNYLSYAALYTHAKTKHNGVFPEGTKNGEKFYSKSSQAMRETYTE